MAIKVKLREKQISGNRQSLYLDFYPAVLHPITGTLTRREFLGLYLFDKPQNPIDKQHNKETLQLAQQIRQKRENNLNKPEIYTDFEKEQLKVKERSEKDFVAYFKGLADKRKASNHDNWISAYKYLEKFTNGFLRFAEVNEQFCDEFKEFLLTSKSAKSSKRCLSKNSAVSYFNKLKAVLKQAYKDGYLYTDLNSKVDCIETEDVIKYTLTLEELKVLAKTEYDNDFCKRVVLFAAQTGIPFMEMKNLTWEQVDYSALYGFRISIQRQKTQKGYYTNISEEAYKYMGERRLPSEKVFEGLNNQIRYVDFQIFLAKAGITKKMTFHDLRHTYGTIQIDMGTDIYTLMGNMGHSNVKQTMRYAKHSNKLKREAADKIKLDV
jgi:integrase